MSNSVDLQQQLRVDGTVFWVVSSTDGPFHVVEGKVCSVDDQNVTVQPVRNWRLGPESVYSEEIPTIEQKSIKRAYFDKTIQARIQETQKLWAEIALQFPKG